MSPAFLQTKFHIPPRRDTSVPRPRLVERLNAGLAEHRKLTLVCAPAGYGKTTLITEWLRTLYNNTPRVAWLSLEPSDNDLNRFFAYVLAAFQQAHPSIAPKIEPFLNLQQLPRFELVLDEVLNHLNTVETAVILVLDDYHLINNTHIHEALEYFLEHQPTLIHLVITTRQDPPLPLARLRARGQMTEIRAHDLRFSPQEAYQFFTTSMKLDVSNEVTNTLDERTEGWAVGLQLAGLALQNQADPMRFIETFRGSHRYVLDFLAEEVIHQQKEEVRSFLMQTSILERFNAQVCCALTDRHDAQATILHLEQANLFIVPLDDDRIWYRYHHLFSEYLRTLLNKSEQNDLYKKAATWFAANNLMVEAVQYALQSEDSDWAAKIIDQALTTAATWSGGNVALLTSWLDALPLSAFHNQPELSLNASRVLYLSGRFDQALQLIELAEQGLVSLPATAHTEQLDALAALYRGAIAAVRGQVAFAIDKVKYAQTHLSQDNHLAQARACFSLGLAYELSGQTTQAVQNYLQSCEQARLAGVVFLAVHACCAAAQLQMKQGRLTLAEQTCLNSLQLANGVDIPPLGLAYTILGNIAMERNLLTTAEKQIRQGIELSKQGGLWDDIVLGLIYLTRLFTIQGKINAAHSATQEASQIFARFEEPRLSLISSAVTARLQLFLGEHQAALDWAKTYQSKRNQIQHEFADVTLARILLANQALETLPEILLPLLEQANQADLKQTSMEVMLLFSLFYLAKQEIKPALEWLKKSIKLAAAEGFTRLFLDEGTLLLELLPKVRQAAPEFVDSLLETLQPESKSPSSPLDSLISPLSEQEQRVLQLIVDGLSNREIASQLFISVGTAKWHVHNIFQKLGVNNRPQAIAKARELGI